MSTLTIRVDGPIMGKGRHRNSARLGRDGTVIQRNYTPARTENAEAFVKWSAISQVGQPMLEGALRVSIVVVVQVPDSWSKIKKRRACAGQIRPTSKPDFDNVSKMLTDALNKIVWKDDAQIVDASFSKVYGEKPGAVLQVTPL